MEESTLWLETDYFEKFRCKGGACRSSCCEGWKISISMKEYFDLIGRNCSDELHRRLESAFVVPENPSPEKFRQIAPNWLGKCPMHGEDGLCMLHKECGEEALPEICRVFPRSMKQEGKVNQACCSSSCEAVIEILMQENQLHFCLAELDIRPEYAESRPADMMKTCARCMWALQNRDVPLARRIGDICDLLGFDGDGGESIEAALPRLANLMERLAEDSPAIRRCSPAAIDLCRSGDWRAASDAFAERFPRWERWFENVLANHFLYMDFPFADGRIGEKQACSGLCLLYGLLRAVCLPCENEQDAVDAMTAVFRLAEHSAFYYNARLMENPRAMLGL